MSLTIRTGVAADLPAIMDVWYATETVDDPNPPPRPTMLSDYPYLLEHGQIWVAEQAHQVVGFAGIVVRSRVGFLTDLFIDPRVQSQGLGAQLLAHTFDQHDCDIRCTVSSSDPRALALYTRAGMVPQWPNFLLRTHAVHQERMRQSNCTVEQVSTTNSALIAWDTHCSGRARPMDLAFWARSEAAEGLLVMCQGQQIGYAVVRFPPFITSARTARIGPVGAATPQDAQACVLAALSWATNQADQIRIDMPGPHAALKTLFDCGFRISYVETFMVAGNSGFVDPRCYCGSGGALF